MLDAGTTAERVGQTINTRVPQHVRIINGVLEEDAASPAGVIIRGEVAKDTLRFIRRDATYQRKQASRPDLFQAIHDGMTMPPLDLAVRTENFVTEGAGQFLVTDAMYAVDGFGRVTEALNVLEHNPNADVRLHAVVHFGSTDTWERHRFTALNRRISKVSGNLHYKNYRDESTAMQTLYGLSANEKDFALYKRVAWDQNMRRDELVSAASMVVILLRLHAHLPPAMRFTATKHDGADALHTKMRRLQHIADAVSLPTFRHNVSAYYGLIDECWDIRQIEYGRQAPQIKAGFQRALAALLSDHEDFWNGQNGFNLKVPAPLRRKLAGFPIHDPHVANLAGGNSSAANYLNDLMVKHINSGKRQRRLVSRYEA